MNTITFLHPDLGLGGAERLVIDAALALQELGYEVRLVTAHYDPARCFEETKTELKGKIRVGGDFIPRHAVGGKFHLFFAILRTVYAGLQHIVLFSSSPSPPPSVLVVDQVAFAVPIFRLLTDVPIVFYCHFPDKLLAPRRGGLLRRLYRKFFDRLEELATGQADEILVNSGFTQSVYLREFPSLSKRKSSVPQILYPCVSLEAFDRPFSRDVDAVFSPPAKYSPHFLALLKSPSFVFVLSINRFERKKGLALALRALKEMMDEPHLVFAGGYDARLAENVEHLEELRSEARELGLESRVWFVPSCTNEEKRLLLHLARVLVYTPEREHFGIVPIEACACSRPVVAVNSGGPLESIVHGSTGFLVEPTPHAFAEALSRFTSRGEGEELAREFGRRGREFVRDRFSRKTFGKELERICLTVCERAQEKNGEFYSSRRRARLVVVCLALIPILAMVLALELRTYVPHNANSNSSI